MSIVDLTIIHYVYCRFNNWFNRLIVISTIDVTLDLSVW